MLEVDEKSIRPVGATKVILQRNVFELANMKGMLNWSPVPGHPRRPVVKVKMKLDKIGARQLHPRGGQ